MATPSRQRTSERAQDDPGVTNDPKSNAAGFDQHIWTSLNQIFERLGKLDQKIDQLSHDQGGLKDSVERHDKVIVRTGFTIAGAVAVIAALWFVYENFLKDHIALK